MHILNGNSAVYNGRQQAISLVAFNPNGVGAIGRWEQICGFQDDIIVLLSEMHATALTQTTMQHSREE